MRVLAVRGENLASLAAPFTVDLESEAIRAAGIFAITGPTGSGKSTILDAICLALYDQLPRLDTAEKGAAIGTVEQKDNQMKYDDVRGVLRHGSASGYAEVDFLGQDGHRYRSRWEVKRSRGKVNGALQAQKLKLTDLDSNTIIGDKKRETLSEIEKRVGLTFQQFRRAVLLAQGDFDAFVRANSKDRAELLEKITGTEIYSKVSRAAFERAKEEASRLQELEAKLGEHQPLNQQQRAEAEGRRQVLAAELQRAQSLINELGRDNAWYERLANLQAALADSTTALEHARKADEDSAPARERLTTVKKALSIRAEFELCNLAQARLEEANRTLTQTREKARIATEGAAHATDKRGASRIDSERERAAYDSIGPQLDEAQRLDTLVQAKAEEHTRAEQLYRRVSTELESISRVLTGVEEQLRLRQEEAKGHRQWLAAQAAVEVLVPRIEDVVKDIQQLSGFEIEHDRNEKELQALETKLNAHVSLQREASARVQGLADNERVLTEQLAHANTEAQRFSRKDLEGRRAHLENAARSLEQTEAAIKQGEKAKTDLKLAEEQECKQKAVIQESNACRNQASAALPIIEAKLHEAQNSLELSEAADSEAAEWLRLKLVPNEPCPVCGSIDHALHQVNDSLRQRVEQDRARVHNLHKESTRLNTDIAAANARLTASEDAITAIGRSRTKAEAELSSAQRHWKTAAERVLECCALSSVRAEAAPATLIDQGVVEWRQEQATQIEAVLSQISSDLRALSNIESRGAEIASHRENVRAERNAAEDALSDAVADEQRIKDDITITHSGIGESTRNIDLTAHRLEPVLDSLIANWRLTIIAEHEKLSIHCRELVKTWRDHNATAERADLASRNLQSDRAGHAARLNSKQVEEEKAKSEVERVSDDLADLRDQRRQIIGGREAGKVRTEFRLRAEAAEKVARDAERKAENAAKLSAAADAALVSAEKEFSCSDLTLKAAEKVLAAKIVACGIDKRALTQAVELGEGWLDSEKERLDTIERAFASAKATDGERRHQVRQHVDAGTPKHSPEELNQAIQDCNEAIEGTSRALLQAATVLEQDDRTNARSVELALQLEACRQESMVWQQLGELIGAADGGKFRRFAQSLTFDRLIEVANHHLADFHPRYELQRVFAGDLALQVIDHDMADEVRAVHSLSGGERFLVSLALALGLATMSSARGIRVDSLFIDEGFGALDSNNLALAISTLERLQATGRQIGVISHVEELKERISVKIDVSPCGAGKSTVHIVT